MLLQHLCRQRLQEPPLLFWTNCCLSVSPSYIHSVTSHTTASSSLQDAHWSNLFLVWTQAHEASLHPVEARIQLPCRENDYRRINVILCCRNMFVLVPLISRPLSFKLWTLELQFVLMKSTADQILSHTVVVSYKAKHRTDFPEETDTGNQHTAHVKPRNVDFCELLCCKCHLKA